MSNFFEPISNLINSFEITNFYVILFYCGIISYFKFNLGGAFMGRKVLFLLVALTVVTAMAFSAAQAYRVTSTSQLLKGPAAAGKVGDYVLKNDKVAFLIGDLNNYHGYMKSGGNVLDAVYNGVEDEFD